MRKIILAAAIAGSALTLTACSEGAEEETAVVTETEAPVEAMGTEVQELGAETEMMVEEGAMEVDQAAAEAEANLEGETVTEAAVD